MVRIPRARRSPRVAATALAAIFLAAACGGESGGSGSSSGDNVAASGPAATAGLAAAQAKYEELTKPPTEVWVPTEKLSQSMAGKTFHYIYVGGVPVFEKALQHTKAAVESSGAELVALAFTPGTDELAAQLQRTVDAKPAGAVIAGAPSSTITAQLSELEAAKVPVVTVATRDKDDVVPGFSGYDWQKQMCEDNAAVVTADSGGTANILYTAFPEVQSASNGCRAGLEAYLAKNCPGCKLEVKNFKLADQFSNKIPSIVTGLLQSRPDTRYVVWVGANAVPGTPQALKAAGIDGVKHVSIGGDTKTWSDIRDGEQLGDLALDVRYLAYRSADLAFRLAAGDGTGEAAKDTIPTQFVTKETAPDPARTTDYFLPTDYVSKFVAAWQAP